MHTENQLTDDGWEGNGPQPEDGAGRFATTEQELRNAHIKGGAVVAALDHLHTQRRADGRPSVFLPELGP